jgi:murein DD-endopeptidase MepM/ murein hydrolase activator NlpD
MVYEKLKKYNLQLIITFFCFSGCASNSLSINQSQTEKIESQNEKREVVNAMDAQLFSQNLQISPGKVKWIQLPSQFINSQFIRCADQNFPLFVFQKKLMAILAESYFSGRKSYECFVDEVKIATVKVVSFPYEEEQLKVSQKKVDLSAEDLARTIEEQKMLDKIYTQGSKTILFEKGFIRPLDSYVTSKYGKRRVFNKKKKTQHLGVDFRAAVGVPIPSANSGRVLFAGDLFYLGLGIIIDHGANIFSVYGHLSELRTQEGEMVNQSTIIGLSGDTGRVSGPHLHWGVKIHGHWVDGLSLIEELL